jgi:serine/threonine protein phosphatase 1
MRRLLDLFARTGPAAPAFEAPLQPDEPLAVIGDVHGCDGLLGRLLDGISGEAAGHRVVVVGDMVDRGENSAAVLRRLADRPDIVCLKGNHEDMVLRFLAEPERAGRSWLRNGGVQTLASFGVGGLSLGAEGRALREAADRLAQAMGPGLIAWLEGLPLLFRSGNVAVVHAGADPRRALDAQEEQVLLWGHPRFESERREDGVWVVHGHVIQSEARAEEGRIAVDTGAYATGHLTAALIGPGRGEFLST